MASDVVRRTRGIVASTLALLACGGCADVVDAGPVATHPQPLLHGRISPSQENYSVRVLTHEDAGTTRCTGTLVAPNVVITARHCVLATRLRTMPACTAAGELVDPNDPAARDLQTERPENITVFHGSTVESTTSVAAAAVFTPLDASLCKNDLAVLVVRSALAAVAMPLRSQPVTRGAFFAVSGWGVTADGETALPNERWTRDDLQVVEVGPGTLPANAFATLGGTLCFGDSGGGAIMAGALVGVYSRIDGDVCSRPLARNVFNALGVHRTLIDRAFAAAGTAAWWDGEPQPGDPPACAAKGACVCGDGASNCADGGEPGTSASAPPPQAVPPGGCGVASSRAAGPGSWISTIALMVLLVALGRTRLVGHPR